MELGYTQEEITDVLSPVEFGHTVSFDSVRRLNQRVRQIKGLSRKIMLSAGLRGSPDGIIARESMHTNVTLNQIHQELVLDRMIREQQALSSKRSELRAQIREEKDLSENLARVNKDSKETMGFIYSPFRIEKERESTL
jgi:hypothetical protein